MKKRMIVGIDPSSKKIALAYAVEGSRPKVEMTTLPAFPDRLPIVHEWGMAFAGQHRRYDIFVFIEKPVQGVNIGATIVQAEVQGALLAGMLAGGVSTIFQVNVQSWKKKVIGKGSVKKPEVARFLKETWPYYAGLAGDDQDLMDAGAILRYGQLTMKITDQITKDLKKGN